MEYYTLLQLKREPFSNSPDPDYFFLSQPHHACLQQLELALRLKRGLNVVIGDVGTGKTTLCRELIRRFGQDPEIETHLILDPAFTSAMELLHLLYAMLCGGQPQEPASEIQIKERIKQSLFDKGVDQHKTVVLIIDEGQKISPVCVEILRELLNYETNCFKLLQIVIFAQSEFTAILKDHASFADRVNLLHHLAPMNFSDTRRMIRHRLKLASQTPKPRDLFTLPALWAIYRTTNGYPRKIVNLCHQSVLAMIIQNRTQAGWALIQSCKNRMASPGRRWRLALISALSTLILLMVLAVPWKELLTKETHHPPEPAYNIPERSQAPVEKVIPTAPEPQAQAPTLLPVASLAPVLAPLAEPKADAPGAPEPPSAVSTPLPKPITSLAPIATIPPAIPVKHAPISEPPAMLGELAVKPGDTLLKLIRLVYGTNANDCVRSVIEANPHIANPNAIDLDDVIVFPALTFQAYVSTKNQVILEEHATLQAARQRLDTLKIEEKLLPRLVAYWNAEMGMRFALTSALFFNGEEAARQWIDRWPLEIRDNARIQSGWPNGTRIYSKL